MKKFEEKINQHWSNQNQNSQKLRWWQSPTIKKCINKRICDLEEEKSEDRENFIVQSAGSNLYLKTLLKQQDKVLKHGVSVGFGTGDKEFTLIEEGLVEKFTLFELADERIRLAEKKAKNLGIDNRIKIIRGNCFEYTFDEKIDFVHWNNSLHHMFNVDEAIKWSYDILEDYGIFYLDDYVGPNRFQFSDEAIKICNNIRSIFPDSYLKNPFNPDILCETVHPFDPNEINNIDPSEAADSENILSALIKYFPNAKIIPTGGTIYTTALMDIINNFNEEDIKDKFILELLMFIDELIVKYKIVETQYVFAIAVKLPKINKYSINNLLQHIKSI